MICAPTSVPIKNGANEIDVLCDHFEPKPAPGQRPVFALHTLGESQDSQTALFALLPTTPGYTPQYFRARWGRMGVGSSSFMPIPAPQIDDARSRPSVQVYGHAAFHFTFRNAQWDIVEAIASPPSIPTLRGDTLAIPSNIDALYAFSDGLPIVDVDRLDEGDHADWRLSKQPSSDGKTYDVAYGGRVWRRHLTPPSLELLAFDLKSNAAESALASVWQDIGGQEEAKRELVRAIQWPVLHPELFQLFKRRRSRGVLLYGPPGCGKTLLGKAVVKLMAALYNRRPDDGGFKYVKGHQLLDQYVGNSEKAVKSLFDEGRRWKETHGYPAVLFFDEADALFKRRPMAVQEASVFTLVPALLAEMDGMDDSGAFVMLATNRPDTLDPAITRAGRIDRRIRITRPNPEAAAAIFRIHLDGVFLGEGLTLESLAAAAAASLFDPAHKLYDVQFEDCAEPAAFQLSDLASGALIHNIVDRATANKMEYCIENGVRKGLSIADIQDAVLEALSEHRAAKHHEELQDYAETRGRMIESITKASS